MNNTYVMYLISQKKYRKKTHQSKCVFFSLSRFNGQ